MEILITGAAGFIGFSCAQFFLKKNIRVVGIDNYDDHAQRFEMYIKQRGPQYKIF